MVADQAPLSMGFSRQEYWSGLLYASPGDYWIVFQFLTFILSSAEGHLNCVQFKAVIINNAFMNIPLFIYWEKAMAPHSSALAWKIPWIEEPGRLQSMGLLRIRQDWATSLSIFTFMHWRRKWQPTPVFLPGESQRRGSLVGCHLWGRTESDTTEAT